jgi:hypothetical protein
MELDPLSAKLEIWATLVDFIVAQDSILEARSISDLGYLESWTTREFYKVNDVLFQNIALDCASVSLNIPPHIPLVHFHFPLSTHS